MAARSAAEKQRAYRERQKAKRNAGSVTLGAEVVAAWRREFYPMAIELLQALASEHGVAAALAAAEAMRVELNEEREWAAWRMLSGTHQGAKLQRLVRQQDPRLVALLHDEERNEDSEALAQLDTAGLWGLNQLRLFFAQLYLVPVLLELIVW
ncbi:MAG: hypothetical protein A2Y73_08905 [Chloroflexi bacterium RBG_13_56_8]|nr:MAG: hypothetical protein A2Y73_08905 [Chloroflexi bacterium RBG_13_56_8]